MTKFSSLPKYSNLAECSVSYLSTPDGGFFNHTPVCTNLDLFLCLCLNAFHSALLKSATCLKDWLSLEVFSGTLRTLLSSSSPLSKYRADWSCVTYLLLLWTCISCALFPLELEASWTHKPDLKCHPVLWMQEVPHSYLLNEKMRLNCPKSELLSVFIFRVDFPL